MNDMSNKIKIGSNEQAIIIYILLAAMTLAVFWQVNQFDFISFDDTVYVTDNSHIKSGITLEGTCWAFGTKYANLWNPLVWVSFMFDYQLFGLNAGGYHMTNVILHMLSTLLLFWLFKRMTRAVWKSAFIASMFAIHPLHVESVAWIAERKDVLSAFFWMLTLCLYVYYTEKSEIKRYLLVLFSFVLALMSKPMVVTLPVMMILLDYWPLKRFESTKINLVLWQIKEKTPFLILSAVLVFITFFTSKEEKTFIQTIPFAARLDNAPVAFMTYLAKTFWPHDMVILYPFNFHIPALQVFGSTLLIIIISLIVILMYKRLPYLCVGWFWYAITILPVIGIIQISLSTPYAMADRYHYLPSIGVSMMLAWGIPDLFTRKEIRRKILLPATIIVLAFLAMLAWRQGSYWKNNATLFKHALQVTKNNYMAHDVFAFVLFENGKFQEALDHCNEALRINPNYAYAYNSRGNIYAQLGKYERAIEDYTKAININPYYIYVYNSRGNAYAKLGNHRQAIEDYNKVIQMDPDYANSYYNRGIFYLNQDNKNDGCRDAHKACSLGMCKVLEEAKMKGLCR